LLAGYFWWDLLAKDGTFRVSASRKVIVADAKRARIEF
jgi:hypothetical protein